MNEKYFNGKYNLILGKNVDDGFVKKLPKKFKVHKVTTELSFQQICFDIKKYELDNDEVFSGNVILNDDTYSSKVSKIITKPLDDNVLYTNSFKHTPYFNVTLIEVPKPYPEELCYCDDGILYCDSFVLWMISNRLRLKRLKSLYESTRFHRIKLRQI